MRRIALVLSLVLLPATACHRVRRDPVMACLTGAVAAAAQAKFKVRMSGRPRIVGGLAGLLPRSSRWSFDVRLEAGTDGWKVAWASWTRLEDGD